jgi:endonuclease-3
MSDVKSINFTEITNLLRNSLGEPEELHRTSPIASCQNAMEVLIATILTQATSDSNALKAWQNLRRVFVDFQQVLAADEDRLIEVIRSGGLALQKAQTIRRVLQVVVDTWGEFSLESLKGDPVEAWVFLNKLPGVGPKTTACTILFGLGLPSFPVDVHINRIAIRLGWVAPKIDPVKTQEILSEIIPFECQSDLHILLLNLGRQYCRPAPRCQGCPFVKQCEHFLQFLPDPG